jgi:DNA (cytosine-5)-methyltransferase 3A
MNKINVLSLFDGISCGRIALERAQIPINQYFASEIDNYAIKVTQTNWPNTIQLGDVTKVTVTDLPKIDLLMGGFCCQSFSFAGKQLNFNDSRGKLFFECVRLLEECKPKWFLFENVVMKKEYQDIISEHLGVQPIMINSSLVSAQNRRRLYWTNIPNINQPEDKGVLLKDIIEELDESKYEYIHEGLSSTGKVGKSYLQYDGSGKGNRSQNYRAYLLNGKMGTLNYSAPHGSKILLDNGRIRKTTRVEHERLQTLPTHYTECLEINKAKAAIGNGWTVDVIAHIFSFMHNCLKLTQ